MLMLGFQKIPKGAVVGEVADDAQAVTAYFAEEDDRERLRPELERLVADFRTMKEQGYRVVEEVGRELEGVKK